ncbi:MAG: hypothetical protein AAF619_08635 [Pseudomonadota bacterium]
MSKLRYTCLACAAAFALIQVGANVDSQSVASELNGSAGASVNAGHYHHLTFNFLVSGHDGTAEMRLNSVDDAPPETPMSADDDLASQADLRSGDIVTTSDLLAMHVAETVVEPTGSLFGPSTLMGQLESLHDDNIVMFDVAECTSLDFDSVSGDLFEERAVCDTDIYSYDLGGDGFRILKNGENYWEIPLTAGLYQLNGVVLAISDKD